MKKSFYLTMAAIVVGGLGLQTFQSCSSPPQTSCTQSIWLLMSGSSVAIPASSKASTHVSVLIVPNVDWDDWNQKNPICAQPTGASLNLTYSCTGVTLPPEVIAMPTPTTPGMQPLPDGGQVFELQIPAGTITQAKLYHNYFITGEYSVEFDDGSTLSSTYVTSGLIFN